MNKYDKLDIADEMLDAAITEFLDEGRYFAALNTAAVAEELYGKAIHIAKASNALDDNISAAQLLLKAEAGEELSITEWKQIANYHKNNIKHFDSGSDGDVEIDPEDEARLMISDALSNHQKLQRVETKNVQRFIEWAKEYANNNLVDSI